ncbi:D-Ala-D-Ala carboxypeptidase family metallohydrolase [Pseudaquabacterium rugosum]|uniref:D-Ala-D-Ala carboxypeptidase family metallohydrolase n=1 Tax=Pseudaquabacterium rugosum TaxID=2984194 RepID=A0ABU9B560_9BURK
MTENFSLSEFTRSTTAARRGLPNTLPGELMPAALQTLAMLERIRAHLSAAAGRDIPVQILSGYRAPAVNTAVGGSANSDHMRASAADIIAPAFGPAIDVARELAAHVGDLRIGQLINEFPGASGWVHVSTRAPLAVVNRVITITAAGPRAGIVSA